MAAQEFFGEGFGPLELGGRLVRTEATQAGRFEGIDHADHERCLGADDGQIDLFALRERDQAGDIVDRHRDVATARFGGRAGVARGDQHFFDARGLRAFPGEGVLASAGSDDQNFHGCDLAVSDGSGACA